MTRSACPPIALALLMLAGCDGAAPGDAEPPSPRGEVIADQATTPKTSGALEQPAATKTPQAAEQNATGATPSIAVVGPGRTSAQHIETGRNLPLARILAIATNVVPGDVVEVNLDDDDDNENPSYALEILTASGRTIEVEIDARTGKILEIEKD